MFSSDIKKNYWNYKTFDFNYSSKKSNIKYVKLISGCYFITFFTLCYMAKKNHDNPNKNYNDMLYKLEWW